MKSEKKGIIERRGMSGLSLGIQGESAEKKTVYWGNAKKAARDPIFRGQKGSKVPHPTNTTNGPPTATTKPKPSLRSLTQAIQAVRRLTALD